ncbi:DUF3604 domain-containing protein [Moritella sp. F3]|uniref:DUF3604 domain-containing protein n=1 Tax=Moritella sp. F3 TaxID=2718882 RepID=UPI0018E103B3|nr:DUF3604 domain-containing protein [Moritella sp. F3]GIC78739.1 hypothetical protein FMO001_34660 [Moritella sp. F1]GIC82658.1 hypothetical protein FMO003_29390 [Moritella sp. F3]
MLIPTTFKKSTIASIAITTLAFSPIANSAGSGGIVSEDTSSMFSAGKKATYSPYAQRNFPDRPLWGDTHLHTAISFDAGTFGASLLPADAYLFAKGKEVISSTGQPVRLSRPLDFLVVADHSDNMGLYPELQSGAPFVMASEKGREWNAMIKAGGQEGVKAAADIIGLFSQGKFPAELMSLPGTSLYRNTWDGIIDAAEDANDPGHFTAFIGYEWTSLDKGNNLHRVIMYRDNADRAKLLEPFTATPPLGSNNPVDLWHWMDRYEEKTAGQVLAIAHNGNLSNGIMFPETTTFKGIELDKEYVETRAKRERLYEVTQIKGDGETHPYLSTNDEFADYETWDIGNLDISALKKKAMLKGEYARSALKTGLQLEDKFGTNPYKFGLIGSTDSHTGLATAQEDNFFGKHSGGEPSKDRYLHPMAKVAKGEYKGYAPAASGWAAVWANENTRASIFDAMQRKETYATTGSRMVVRFFGGWDFDIKDASDRQPARVGYAKGVPMGANLTSQPKGKKAPTFLVAALKDPLSGNLDRIQIIKGWLDNKGGLHEQVYNVVWSDDRKADTKGKLPAVGNTVDIASATWTNSIGEPELITVWQDPNFDAKQSAFYYARVIEIPTPRWTAYEAEFYNLKMPAEVPMITTERAYTSPIWFTPVN